MAWRNGMTKAEYNTKLSLVSVAILLFIAFICGSVYGAFKFWIDLIF